MKRRLFFGVVSMCVALVAGCGGGASSGKTTSVQPGDMPEGGDWDGVYYSELYGNLHLVRDGNAISGRWERPHKDKCGTVNGTVTGDMIRFQWKELTVGLVGPNAVREGKGYLKYKRPADGTADMVVGERGLKLDEVGDPWEAVKQKDAKPDLSAQCGAGAGELGGGDWDKENKEEGKPEGPAAPPPP